MAYEASRARAHRLKLCRSVGLKIPRSLHDRDRAKARRSKRPITSGTLRAIDHAASLVSCYRDTPIDMADYEGAFLIPPSDTGGMKPRDPLLIQHMGLSAPVDTLYACYPSDIIKLIDIGWVEGIHRLTMLRSKLVGHHHSELRGMIAAPLVVTRISIEALIYLHHSLRLGIGTSAASYEHVYVIDPDAMAGESLENDLCPERKLIIRRLIAKKHGSIMEYALREYLTLIIEHAYLRGC